MTTEELKAELASQPRETQQALKDYLTLLIRHDAAWREDITRRLNDRSAGRWISLEEVERRLAGDSHA
jgi:hypothetical protein